MGLQTLQQIKLGRLVLVISRCTANLVHPLLQNFQICEDEFQIDGFNIPDRVYAAVHMDDIRVFKAAHDMDNRIALADVCKELVAESLTLRRALDESCNVDELNDRRCDLLCMIQIAKQLQPLIRHRHNPDVRVDCAERIVCSLCPGFRQGIKQSTLSNIRKSDDS